MAEQSFKVDGGIEAVGIITSNAFRKVGGSSTEFLMADGSIDSSTYSKTDTNTTYEITAADHTSNKKLIRLNDGSTNKDVVIAGGNNVIVSRTNDEISIASSETTYDISAVDGAGSNKTIRLTGTGPGAATTEVTLVAGTNISLGRTDNQITINSSGTTYSVGDGGLTQNNFTDALKTKLDGIATNADANVNSDWNATAGISSILNKPVNISTWTNDVGFITATTTSDIIPNAADAVSIGTVDKPFSEGHFGNVQIGVGNPGTEGDGEIKTASGTLTLDSSNGTTKVDDNLIVTGDLTVQGTQTTVNTTILNIADNEITLNSDVTGTPSENAGVEVERGTSTNTRIRWNETNDKWEFTNDGTVYNNLASYSVSAADGGTAQKKLIRLSDSNGVNDDVTLVAGNGITLARSNDEITITNNAPDTDTTYSQSCVDSSNDVILRLTDSSSTNDDIKVKAGSNITLTHDNANEFTIAASSASGVPTGCILMWSGSISSIPSGWHLCDGVSGRPDLRNRFVIGAGDTYAIDATGGNENVTLSISQMPSHSHSGTTGGQDQNHTHDSGNIGTNNDGSHSHTLDKKLWNGLHGTGGTSYIGDDAGAGGGSNTGTSNEGGHSHNISGTTTGQSGNHAHSFNTNSQGSGSSIDIRPKYYALCYIIKL